MSNTSVERLVRNEAEASLRAARVPGLVIAAAEGDSPARYLALGTDAGGAPLTADSLLPVASLTKLATALAVLRLVDAGRLVLDEPLGRLLPQAAAAQPGVTIRRLLSHTSGLPLDLETERAPYRSDLDWPRLARACLETPLERAPDTRVQYSNVGYGLLAVLVERLAGQDFPLALSSLVLEPLGIEAYLGVEPPRPVAVIADVRSEHTGTALEPFNSPFWRSLGFPWGGLVTTAAGALALVRAFHNASAGLLRDETRAEATRNQVGDLGGGMAAPLLWPRSPWGLGPELRGHKDPHWAPAQADPESFGHAGLSGCLAWLDPTRDVAWAILGTRTADNGWLLRRAPLIGAAILGAPR